MTKKQKLFSTLEKMSFKEGSRNEDLIPACREAIKEGFSSEDSVVQVLQDYCRAKGHSEELTESEILRAFEKAKTSGFKGKGKKRKVKKASKGFQVNFDKLIDFTAKVEPFNIEDDGLVYKDSDEYYRINKNKILGICSDLFGFSTFNVAVAKEGKIINRKNLTTSKIDEIISSKPEFISVNPYRHGDEFKDENTSKVNHLIIEWDEKWNEGWTLEQFRSYQLRFINKLLADKVLPIKLIVDTANKGFHVWLNIEGIDVKGNIDELKNLIGALGADESMVNVNRLSRFPLALRDGKVEKVQRIIYQDKKTKPINYESLVDYLKSILVEVADCEDEKPYLIEGKKGALEMQEFFDFLDYKGWTVRHNITLDRFEYEGFDGADLDNPDTVAYNLRGLLTTGGRSISTVTCFENLAVLAGRNKYNPVVDYLGSLEWDEVDRLNLVYKTLGLTDELDKTLVKKWLIQTVAMPHNEQIRSFGADGVLTLLGKQGIGKTSFFRALVPEENEEWFAEGVNLNTDDKDSVLRLMKGWIIELGEVDGTTKREQSSLKSLITANVDEVRPPYGRSLIRRPRMVSMGATVNDDGFLRDEENRRWWTVEVNNIKLEMLDEIIEARDQIWAQVVELWKKDNQGFRLTRDEQKRLNNRNSKFRQMPYHQELYDLVDLESIDLRWLSASEVAEELNIRAKSMISFGRSLRVFCEDNGIEVECKNNRTRYHFPVRDFSSRLDVDRENIRRMIQGSPF